jgi:O-antigen/teichoic acid export membrane protein
MRGVLRRLSWGVADQGMASLTNIMLSLYIAHALGAVQYGAFSLAYVTYGFALNASRGLAVEPLMIRYSGASMKTWRRATKGSTGTSILVGLVTGTLALTAGIAIGGTTGQAFLALGLTLPGLLLQETWRFAFFTLGRGYHAFINDTVWAVIQIPALLLLKMTGHANVFWFTLAWGLSGSAAAAIGGLQARVLPNLLEGTYWLIRHNDLGPRYLAENTGGNAANTLQGYAVSYILGLAAVGYIQAANTVMGPLKIIIFGIGLITLPGAVMLLRRSPRKFPVFCASVSVALTLLALVWGVVLLVGLPRGLGSLMLGKIWEPTYPLVLPVIFFTLATCAATGANLGLHALGAARRSLRVTLTGSALILSAAVVGALTGGMLGTMRYSAVAAWVVTLMSWWQFRQALMDTGRVPGWMWPRAAGRHQAVAAAEAGHLGKAEAPRSHPGQVRA